MPTGRITFSVSLLGQTFDHLYMQLSTPQFSFDSVSVEAFDEPWKRVSFLSVPVVRDADERFRDSYRSLEESSLTGESLTSTGTSKT